jgi:diacylglycerol kinase family enzyme
MNGLIPAIINTASGSAGPAARALVETGGFEIHEVQPADIRRVADEIIAAKPGRVVACGGDGTVSTVAHRVANTGVELAILPGGTLNHLARHLGLPEDLREAAAIARRGITRTLDAGRVNDRLFLNTSSVGAYERFVRHRERLERQWGYTLASLTAGLRLLMRTPLFAVRVEVDGIERVHRTPLVFVGVGERELRIPSLGGRTDRGKRGLHLMIVRDRTGARLASLALQAAARGVGAVSRTPAMDSLVVTRCMIEPPGDTVSIDGELASVRPPLEYEFLADALTVVIGERRDAQRASL